MRPVRQLAILAWLAVIVGCSERDRESSHIAPVEVSSGLPAAITNALLIVRMSKPNDASPTNYKELISGTRSLQSPMGSSSSGQNYQEERLVAIKPEGFVLLFTDREGEIVHTNLVVFPYGQTTETNALGWKIVGQYK